ncbi:hypothetical protein OG559_05930 [Micromonospora sp. NBC_01405]|uniref:hypothetical protein n=1 Tax=Micromonospora sp. NBC_01405 TaxID=2903589 RepID=UPI003247204F
MSVTVDVWDWGTFETSTKTETVAADGTIVGHYFWTEDITGQGTARTTIRDASGSVLAASPEAYKECPIW